MSPKLQCDKIITSRFIDFFFSRKLKEQIGEIESAYILGAIESNLRQIFGEIGGCVDIELLSFENNKNLILKVAEEDSKKVRVALTLLHNFREIPCHFKIERTSNIPIKALT